MSEYEKELEKLQRSQCPDCRGLGDLNDADLGDIYCNVWACPTCRGSGFDPEVRYTLPTDEEMKLVQKGDDRDTHTEHCCLIHGCKYGKDDCVVTNKKKIQSFLCENCHMEAKMRIKKIG